MSGSYVKSDLELRNEALDTEIQALRDQLARVQPQTWDWTPQLAASIGGLIDDRLDDLETELRREYDGELESMRFEINELHQTIESETLAAIERHEQEYDHDTD